MAAAATREMLAKALAEEDQEEAFAQMLYSLFGGFVEWAALPEESRSKDEYREKGRHLLKLLDLHRKRHGEVTIPIDPTPEMLEAGYRAMLAARPKP